MVLLTGNGVQALPANASAPEWHLSGKDEIRRRVAVAATHLRSHHCVRDYGPW